MGGEGDRVQCCHVNSSRRGYRRWQHIGCGHESVVVQCIGVTARHSGVGALLKRVPQTTHEGGADNVAVLEVGVEDVVLVSLRDMGRRAVDGGISKGS